MADMAGVKEPPDIRAGKSYKYRAKSFTNSVVCIICEEVYYLSDFNRLKNTTFLSDVLVICNNHGDITSKVDENTLDKNVRCLIADIKLNEKNAALAQMQADVDLSLSTSKNSNVHDNTILEDDPDIRSIITQNTLLKQLYEEVKHKNQLLLNTIELMKQNKQIYPSYAEVSKLENKKLGKVQDIKIISSSDSVTSDNALKQIKSVIQKEIKLPFKKVINTKNNETIVKCQNNEDVKAASKLLQIKLGDTYAVTMLQPDKPKLRIFGINKDMQIEDLENDINQRNFLDFDKTCQVIRTFNTANKTFGAILQLDSELYDIVAKNNFRIFIGDESYYCSDDIISMCPNCSGFNHGGAK